MRSSLFSLSSALCLPLVAATWTYSSVEEHCSDIYSFTGDAGLEAQTVVTDVTLVPANGTTGTPAYCSVTAFVNEFTGILLWLPAKGADWRGIYSGHGCGGSCGATGLNYVYGYGSGPYGEDLLRRGYIASGTDMGHQNGVNDTLSSWSAFRNNRTVEYNFAYLSTHLLAVSGKALAEFYYGNPPEHSFWRGGSTGGRQGLMIAQRYPHDFDAIIVGYAASNETGIGAIQFPYLAQSSTYANGSYILTIADIQALHAGAVAACDGNDGLVDGLVNPAYKCDFDPIAILCSRNKTTNCLANMDKVTAARKMYTYPSNSRTNKLIDSRYVPGSEIEWATWTNAYGGDFATSFTMNAAFQQDLPLNWTLAEYDWESYPYMVGPMEDIYGVGDADLSIFRDKGGKIIHYQGWADANVAPMWNLNYYKKVLAQMGGAAEVQKFYRFFMYPGMAHIDVGDNSTVAYRCAYYDYLEDWYFNDVAPETMLVQRVQVATNETIDYRPHWPYPLVAKFTGKENLTSSIDDVKKWKGVKVAKGKAGIV